MSFAAHFEKAASITESSLVNSQNTFAASAKIEQLREEKAEYLTEQAFAQAKQLFMSGVSTGRIRAAYSVGAALALDGTVVAYAQSLTDTTDTNPRRISINTILTIPAGEGQTLTVVNNTDETVSYTNASLTVVKLS